MKNRDRIFSVDQWVPKPRRDVFSFFSDPKNLEKITPPWLNLHVVGQSTPEIEKGTIFTYRLKVRGIPITWKSLVEELKKDEFFVDVQVKGPYAKWNHMHLFEDKDHGTLIRDRVIYRVPFGVIGRLLAGSYVKRDLRQIFEYRRQAIDQILAS